MMTPAQCRAARALLDWSQQALADAAKVGNATIRNFEGGRSAPQSATLQVLRQTLESAGIIFVEQNGEGPGVRMRKRRDPAAIEQKIDELHAAAAELDVSGPPSPRKAMNTMKKAVAKNEAAKLKGKLDKGRKKE